MSEPAAAPPRFLTRGEETRANKAGLAAIASGLAELGAEPEAQDAGTYGRRGTPQAMRTTRAPEVVDLENAAEKFEACAETIIGETAEVATKCKEAARLLREIATNLSEQINERRKMNAQVASLLEPVEELVRRNRG